MRSPIVPALTADDARRLADDEHWFFRLLRTLTGRAFNPQGPAEPLRPWTPHGGDICRATEARVIAAGESRPGERSPVDVFRWDFPAADHVYRPGEARAAPEPDGRYAYRTWPEPLDLSALETATFEGPLTPALRRRIAKGHANEAAAQLRKLDAAGLAGPEDTQFLAALARWSAGEVA